MPKNEQALRDTANLIQEVKAFGQTRGLEPTGALSRTTEQQPRAFDALAMAPARRDNRPPGPVDIRLAIGFSNTGGRIPLEQVYRVDGYSVYYRQGNEFADERSVATTGFASEGAVRRVTVVLHEDLHGDNNFDLPWETEEAIVTPLGALAAVEFFRQKNDAVNLESAIAAVDLQRKFSRELNEIVAAAREIFRTVPLPEAKTRILDLLPNFRLTIGFFSARSPGSIRPRCSKRSSVMTWPTTVFRPNRCLSEKTPGLGTLISELKKLPHDARQEDLERYLDRLEQKKG